MSAALRQAEVVKDAQGLVHLGPLDGPSRFRVEHKPDGSVVLTPFDAPDVAAEFARLKAEWETADPCLSSDWDEIASHPAYRAIIALGPPVVPFLIADLRSGSYDWLVALEEIVGGIPIEERDFGNFRKIREEWVTWYERQDR